MRITIRDEAGDAIDEVTARGEPVHDDTMLVLLNASELDVPFTLPQAGAGKRWQLELDTARPAEVPTAPWNTRSTCWPATPAWTSSTISIPAGSYPTPPTVDP